MIKKSIYISNTALTIYHTNSTVLEPHKNSVTWCERIIVWILLKIVITPVCVTGGDGKKDKKEDEDSKMDMDKDTK